MTAPREITDQSQARVPAPAIFRAAGLDVQILPDAAWRASLQASMNLTALRKVRLAGQIAVIDGGLVLTAQFGATVVQPCVVTLEPVQTRIEAPVRRTYLDNLPVPAGDEAEIPQDDSLEALGPVIDLAEVLAEALSLNLPLYPRAAGAELGQTIFTGDDATPMTDEDTKPFAGLEALKSDLPEASGSDD
ncbi:MAG: DUF177 domain-containing protein [Pseudomonadota bacterium]